MLALLLKRGHSLNVALHREHLRVNLALIAQLRVPHPHVVHVLLRARVNAVDPLDAFARSCRIIAVVVAQLLVERADLEFDGIALCISRGDDAKPRLLCARTLLLVCRNKRLAVLPVLLRVAFPLVAPASRFDALLLGDPRVFHPHLPSPQVRRQRPWRPRRPHRPRRFGLQHSCCVAPSFRREVWRLYNSRF